MEGVEIGRTIADAQYIEPAYITPGFAKLSGYQALGDHPFGGGIKTVEIFDRATQTGFPEIVMSCKI